VTRYLLLAEGFPRNPTVYEVDWTGAVEAAMRAVERNALLGRPSPQGLTTPREVVASSWLGFGEELVAAALRSGGWILARVVAPASLPLVASRVPLESATTASPDGAGTSGDPTP
jgi:hypothetical protein